MEAIMRRCNIVDLGIKIKTALPNFTVNCLLGRFYFNCEHFLFVFCKSKTKQKCCGYYKKVVDFQNLKKSNFVRSKFLKIGLFENFPWGQVRSHKNLGSIGSAVLTFIGYKQADTQTDKQCINID